ncbi:MAG: gliding motility lipoprotein GldJ [Flavobacteriales bacterium]
MTKSLLISIVSILVLSSCSRFFGGRGRNGKSETTGWDISNPVETLNAKTRYDAQKTGPGLVFIEGGTFVMGRTREDVMHNWNNAPTRQQVHSFYMDETEVTNIAYREYLSWLKRVFPPSDERFSKIWLSALPDTTVWRDTLSYNEVYVKNYLRHPAYSYYPVVGVNWLQANRYAAWRTDRVNERILTRAGYISKEKSGEAHGAAHFSTEAYLNEVETSNSVASDATDTRTASGKSAKRGKRKSAVVRREDGILLPAYRLPTEVEWEYAAVVPNQRRVYNIRKGRESPIRQLRNRRIGKKGDFLANFKRRAGDYSGVVGWSNDGAAAPSETRTFPPNDAGLYDMEGNVAEWVADVYKPTIDTETNDLNYYRGNTFTKVVRKDGKTAVVTETVTYDTLPNGKLVYHDLPGQVRYKKSGDTDAYPEGSSPSDSAFYSGDSPPTGLGQNNRNTPDSHDEFRVVKGGSWRDRAYWLDPAERRFMREDRATSWIGFRCAMDRVGHKTRGRTRRN